MAPLSIGFSKQEYSSRFPFRPPGDLPKSGIKPASLMFLALADGFFTTSTTWEAQLFLTLHQFTHICDSCAQQCIHKVLLQHRHQQLESSIFHFLHIQAFSLAHVLCNNSNISFVEHATLQGWFSHLYHSIYRYRNMSIGKLRVCITVSPHLRVFWALPFHFYMFP